MSPGRLAADPLAVNIMVNLRIPRIITSLIAGAVLGASGFVFQMLFSNPLVEPGFLGVSQGASFGAASAILLFGNAPAVIQISAALWALAGLFLSFFLARRFHFGGWILRLVLSGIAVSAFFSSGLGLIKYAADPLSQLQEITFWLLGGLWNVSWGQLFTILPVTILSLTLLFAFRWRVNLLSMDDRTSHSVGLAPRVEKPFILITATLGTAAVISVSGLIGWVGLIVPHISRRLFGSNASLSLPGSMTIGAVFMLVCDTLGRSLFTGELPLGIVTSLFGTIGFVLLLSSKKGLGETI
jgi:iron complex transport system permease protein